jgi:hypothetical protein
VQQIVASSFWFLTMFVIMYKLITLFYRANNNIESTHISWIGIENDNSEEKRPMKQTIFD